MIPIFASAEFSSLWDPSFPLVWLVGIWLAGVGACFGSFLNVVIYRVPAGKSVVHPGSHCPKCGHAIRWYDNLPVLSWLLLRARCRDCRVRIPVRYPLVEALVAALFAGLAIAELFCEGANLPGAGAGRSVEALAGIYAYHLVLLVTLVAVVFIHFDGHPTPWKVVLPAFLAGGAAAIWPWLHPLPIWPGLTDAAGHRPWWTGLCGVAAGGGAGLSVALLTFPLAFGPAGGRSLKSAWMAAAPATCLVGMYLGWPAAIGIGAVTAVVDLLCATAGRAVRPLRRVPWTGCLLVTTVTWLVLWRALFLPLTYLQWLKPESALCLGVVILCASALTRTILSPGPAAAGQAEDE